METGRAFLEWFLPAPPDLPKPELIPDFRLYRDVESRLSDTRALLDAQLWAETQRDLVRGYATGPWLALALQRLKAPRTTFDAR